MLVHCCNPVNCLAILSIALQSSITCAISMQSNWIWLIVQGFLAGLWSQVIQWTDLFNFWCNQCNLSKLSRIASNSQSIHNWHDCESFFLDCTRIMKTLRREDDFGHWEITKARFWVCPLVRAQTWSFKSQSVWVQFLSNRSANYLNCIRIAKNKESSCNRPDCKIRRHRLQEALRGLQGTPKHISRLALYSGLRLDQQPLG